MNNNLYVNVGELIDLIDCIEKRNDHPKSTETIQEVVNVMHDLEWVEIEPHEVKKANKRDFKRFELCQRIKSIFDKSGLTYVEIAKRLEIPRSLVYHYIDEEHTPGAEKIAKICKEFDVSADWLIFGE